MYIVKNLHNGRNRVYPLVLTGGPETSNKLKEFTSAEVRDARTSNYLSLLKDLIGFSYKDTNSELRDMNWKAFETEVAGIMMENLNSEEELSLEYLERDFWELKQ